MASPRGIQFDLFRMLAGVSASGATGSTMAATDAVYRATSGTGTVTLVAAATAPAVVAVINEQTSNPILVDANASETINGDSTAISLAPRGMVLLINMGTGWWATGDWYRVVSLTPVIRDNAGTEVTYGTSPIKVGHYRLKDGWCDYVGCVRFGSDVVDTGWSTIALDLPIATKGRVKTAGGSSDCLGWGMSYMGDDVIPALNDHHQVVWHSKSDNNSRAVGVLDEGNTTDYVGENNPADWTAAGDGACVWWTLHYEHV